MLCCVIVLKPVFHKSPISTQRSFEYDIVKLDGSVENLHLQYKPSLQVAYFTAFKFFL